MKDSKRCSAEDAYESALRILSAREHSRHQLVTKLKTRGFSFKDIEATLTRLQQLSYLDDARFAEMLLRERVLRRGFGFADAQARLRRAGVGGEEIERATALVREEVDEADLCMKAAQKKNRELNENDPRKRYQKLARFLQSRGFPTYLIRDALETLTDES